MDDPQSVAQFHAGGANPGMQAVYDFSARALDALLPEGARLLDLGAGSGRALAYLARLRPDLHITGVDLAPNMLATARDLFADEGMDGRIELVEADITALPAALTGEDWDGISSVWTLHQLPDVELLRRALRQMAAVRKRSGAAVWLCDFRRLRSPDTFPAFFDVVDPSSPPVLRKDAIASEAAAFSHEELAAELRATELGDVLNGHSRPLPWLQAWWAPRRSSTGIGNAISRPGRLPGSARGDAALLRAGFTAKPF